MKVLIAIPIYITKQLHLDFTRETVDSIKSIHKHDIVFVKNRCAPELEPPLRKMGLTVINNPSGNSVTAAWNMGITRGIKYKYDYILIPNNDIIFHPKAVDNLVKFAEQHPEFVLWTASEHVNSRTLTAEALGDTFDEHPHFSCFMVSPKTVELLEKKERYTKETLPGLFDEDFRPAYFEDGDYHNRLLRAGFKAGKTASSRFYHYGSRTIGVDDRLNIDNAKTYEINRKRFIEKWGWDPHNSVMPNDDKRRFEYKAPYTP
jgi:GT2 family glycosyltransferase